MIPGDPRLELLRLSPERGASAAALDRLLAEEPARLFALLRHHRVDQLWYRAVRDLGWEERLPGGLVRELKQARRTTAALVLLQLEAARRAAGALAGAGVAYVFFKGFQLGEELYGDAVLRPAADVDLLIAEGDRGRALAALGSAGFDPAPEEGQPAYQLTFAGHGAALDLHWRLLPPERLREPLAGPILESRCERGGLWFPDAGSTLAILLLNPAVTDHVTARLIHAVDLDRWLRSRPADRPTTLELVARSGLRTAAWAMLDHTRRLLETPVTEEVERRLAPGPWRRRYLRRWLVRDPARLHGRHRLLVRAGFSLFLHDRPGDAARALIRTLASRG